MEEAEEEQHVVGRPSRNKNALRQAEADADFIPRHLMLTGYTSRYLRIAPVRSAINT
jgi:hypothetical protein